MTAPAHPTTAHGRKRAATSGGVQTRLHWWALVLPALGFAILLLLLLGGPADAAQHASASPALTFLVQVRDALLS